MKKRTLSELQETLRKIRQDRRIYVEDFEEMISILNAAEKQVGDEIKELQKSTPRPHAKSKKSRGKA